MKFRDFGGWGVGGMVDPRGRRALGIHEVGTCLGVSTGVWRLRFPVAALKGVAGLGLEL